MFAQSLRLEIPHETPQTFPVSQAVRSPAESSPAASPPLRQYLMSVSTDGAVTLTPIAIAAVAIDQIQPASSETMSPGPAAQQQVTIAASSSMNPLAIDTAQFPSTESLLSTPVSFGRDSPMFRPQDILPLPQVAQIGPRNAQTSKRRGAAKCLTDSPELKRIREEFEGKQRKTNKVNLSLKLNVDLSNIGLCFLFL